MHAGALAEQLRRLRPDLSLSGIGGDRMAAAGVALMERIRGIAGIVEVVRHIPSLWASLSRVRARLATGNVALVVLVDYGGFNLRAGAAARAAGVPVLYFITPQVWASRAGRLKTMAQVITKAAVILPFEEELLRAHGIDATFVGHPLLDRARDLPTRAEARRRLGLPETGEVLALFPGSRAQEIERHADRFRAAARELERRRPGLQVVVSAAESVAIDADRLPYPTVQSASFDLLRAADVALCKSGTTTLEAAIAGCPSAVVYRTNPLTFQILKRIVRVSRIGLVNIVAGREVVPEFVQDAFQPLRVADALGELFDAESPARRRMIAGLDEVRSRLGSPGAAARVAAMASELLS
jgi:lipid-A-disaccharide synthase